jgi:His/Glu/Gln/Arg/opine family amino acid ABC transporter permease subunit
MELLWVSLPLLGRGTLVTLMLASASVILATAIGLAGALIQLFAPAVLRWQIELYLYLVRGIPLLVLLFAMYYALPYAGIMVEPEIGGVVVIGAYFGAFMTEVFRAAVLAIPAAQWEAGRVIGLSTVRIMLDIIAPQALRIAGPPFINTCIMVVKGTSLVAIIGLADITYVGRQIVERTLAPFLIFGAVAFVYFVICYLLSRIGRRLEERLDHAQ